MADVQIFTSWSTTASSNKPAGTDVVGTGLADNLREIQAQVKTSLAHYNSTPVASGATVDLGAQTGAFLLISGTTTITAFGTASAGIWKTITFQGALTLTHNATSLILPGGANITTAAGDTAIVVSLGSGNWRCVSYTRADGTAVVGSFSDGDHLTSSSSSASGTAVDFTSIPSWVTRITLLFKQVSLSGTDNIEIQIGDSTGFSTSGYGGSYISGNTSFSSAVISTGFYCAAVGGNTYAATGSVTITSIGSNTWVCTGSSALESTALMTFVSGYRTLSNTLDRVRFKPTGSDTFDNGTVVIIYE